GGRHEQPVQTEDAEPVVLGDAAESGGVAVGDFERIRRERERRDFEAVVTHRLRRTALLREWQRAEDFVAEREFHAGLTGGVGARIKAINHRGTEGTEKSLE